MAKCVNINHPDFLRLVDETGMHPAVLSAKMGVWMEQNNTDNWPTLEQLNINKPFVSENKGVSLDSKLLQFLNNLNFTTEFRDDLKDASEYNPQSLTDLLYKTILVNNNYKQEGLLKETAYVVYSFLGKKNKIRTDLLHSIENITNYSKIHNDYKKRSPNLSEGKIKELIVIDFIADAIKNNFELPKDSYQNRKAEYWQIKGGSKLERQLKYLLLKIKSFVESLFDNKLSNEEIIDLLDDLANDVLNLNFDKFGTILSESQQLTNYENTINKDKKAKDIIETFQELGLLLTGSLSLRRQGTLYREVSEDLHDLDFTLTADKHGEFFDSLLTELDKNFEGASESGKSFLLDNLTKTLDKAYKKHPILKSIKDKYPSFKITNSFKGNNNEVIISGDIDGYAIDLFFVKALELDTNEKSFQDWQPIFLAKLKMGRLKDIRDFANYIPFNSIGINKFAEIKGFRHFSFNLNKDVILSKTRVIPNQFDYIAREIVNKTTWRDVAKLLLGYNNALGKTIFNGHVEILRKDDPELLAGNVAHIKGFANAINRIIPGLLEPVQYNEYWKKPMANGKYAVKYRGWRLAIHQSALDHYHGVVGNQNLPEGPVPNTPLNTSGQLTIDFSDTRTVVVDNKYPDELDPTLKGEISSESAAYNKAIADEIMGFLNKNQNNRNIIDVINNLKTTYGISIPHERVLDIIKNNKEFQKIDFQIVTRLDIATKYPDRYKEVKDSDGFIITDKKLQNTTIYILKDNIAGFGSSTIDSLMGTLLHEAIHAITMEAIINPATEEQRIIKRELNSIYIAAKAKSKLAKQGHPGFGSLEEFMADGITDPKILQELNTSEFNFLERIWNAILKFFGLSPKTVEGQTFKSMIEILSKYNTINVTRHIPRLYQKRQFMGTNDMFKKYLYELGGSDQKYQDVMKDKVKVAKFFKIKLDDHLKKGGNIINSQELLEAERVVSALNIGGTASDIDKLIKNFNEDELIPNKKDSKKKSNVNNLYNSGDAISNAINNFNNRYKITSRSKQELINKFKSMFGSDATVVTNAVVWDNDAKIYDIIDFIVFYNDKQTGTLVYSIINLFDGNDEMKDFNTSKSPNKKDPNYVVFRPASLRDRNQLRLHLDTMLLYPVIIPVNSNYRVLADRRYIVSLAQTSDGQYDLDREFNNAYIHELHWYSNLIDEIRKEGFQKIRERYLEQEVTIDTSDEVIQERSDTQHEEFRQFMYAETNKTEIQQILLQTVKNLNTRKRLETMFGNKYRAEEVASAMSNIITKHKEPVEAMNEFIDYAGRILAEAAKDMKNSWSKDVASDKKKLVRYYSMLGSFEILRDYEQYLVNVVDTAKTQPDIQSPGNVELREKYRDRLQQAIKDIDYIKNQYISRAIKLLATELVPYYNIVKIQHIETAKRDYRLNKYNYEHGIETPKLFNPAMSEDEYVYAVLNTGPIKKSIEKDSMEGITAELKKGIKDIGYLEMIVDNVLDTGDAAVGAFVKFITQMDDEKRIWVEEERRKYETVVKEFYDHLNKSGKVFPNYQSIYDFMLEKDKNGKYTGYIISKLPSDLVKEKKRIIINSQFILNEDKKLEDKERRKFINGWLNDNMPLNNNNFVEGIYTYLKELTLLDNDNPNHITEKEYNLIVEKLNLTDIFPKFDKEVKDGYIREEVVNLIRKWTNEHIDDYREVGPAWDTSQWDALQEILKDPNDIRTKVYNAIVEMQRNADNLIPGGLAIGARLPGVIKQKNERLASGQNLYTMVTQSLSRTFTFQVDDTHRPQEIVDDNGDALYWIPIHYAKPVLKKDGDSYIFDEDNQSFDLFGIYFSYYASAMDYSKKYNILAEITMFRDVIKQREIVKRDSFGSIIKNGFEKIVGIETQDAPKIVGGNIANQVNSWINAVIFGEWEKEAGVIPGTNIDVGKLLQFLKKYTAANLLGLNITQGLNNVSLGEINQWIEAISGQYMSKMSYLKAHKLYAENLPGMISDLGARVPDNFLTLLAQHFDIVEMPSAKSISQMSKAQSMRADKAIHSINNAGEHFMKVKLLTGMLYDKKAYDKEGKVIGSIMDFYSLDDKGKLIFDKDGKVDIERSEWTKLDQTNFKQRVEGVASRLHGDYSNLAVTIMQQNAFLSMAYMFRKFMAPGIRRHWGKKRYEERTMEFQVGIYPTMYEHLIKPGFQLATWWRRTEEELALLKQYTLGQRWAMLSDQERANIIRGLLELVTFAAIILFIRLIDDDEEELTFSDNFLMYQLLRLKAELTFYVSIPSAMSILRSPAASMSVVENVGTVLKQAANPLEVYESGPWKGQLKIYKHMVNMIPVYRQYYRVKNIDTQIPWFKR